ncbi:MAG: hypothetical protein JXN61_11415 [Sedimentisphaerales bacterium]|nr:hypothetical protein [Sedimentisphaerales bacterium]
MRQALIVIGGLAVAIIVAVGGLFIVMVIRGRRRTDTLLRQIYPIIARLQKGEDVPAEEIQDLVSRPETRSLTYRALKMIGQEELFPEEYRTLVHIAESDLVAWLLHPNELNAIPDNIELVEVIEREDEESSEKCRFYLFRFRTLKPHWMANRGWVAGIAGPYWDGKDPDVSPEGVFSELEPFDSLAPEEHLAKIERIVMRKLKWKI